MRVEILSSNLEWSDLWMSNLSLPFCCPSLLLVKQSWNENEKKTNLFLSVGETRERKDDEGAAERRQQIWWLQSEASRKLSNSWLTLFDIFCRILNPLFYCAIDIRTILDTVYSFDICHLRWWTAEVITLKYLFLLASSERRDASFSTRWARHIRAKNFSGNSIRIAQERKKG